MALPTSKNQLVLITGVNGYIASQTAKSFLDAGYSVRGTARSKSSSAGLIQVLDSYVKDGRFEVVEVNDILAPGAFDEAVKGCHAIAHLASPVSQFFTDPEPIIRTAVEGTTSLMTSAIKYGGSSLQSVVLMSSVGAIIEPKDPPYTYTELDWNNFSVAEVSRLGTKTPGGHIYRASKVAAEQAFWKFRDEHKPTFVMTAVNPAFVCGPPLVLPEAPEKINETVIAVWTILSGRPIPPSLGGSGAFVDVRDVADLMVNVVEKRAEGVDGERYIACSGVGSEQAIADILNKHYVSRKGLMDIGKPGVGYVPGHGFKEGGNKVDARRGEGLLGRKWRGYEESVLDAAKVFERYL